MRAVRYLVRGRVQGVGFRWFVLHAARAEGLAGWVRNLADGTVEAVASGDAQALARFREALESGPPRSRVEAVEESAADGAGLIAGRFEIA